MQIVFEYVKPSGSYSLLLIFIFFAQKHVKTTCFNACERIYDFFIK